MKGNSRKIGHWLIGHWSLPRRGFTLIELTVVVAVIAILAGGIFVAIDPARRLHESRNARRLTDVQTILEALKSYQADNSGAHYTAVENIDSGIYKMIGLTSLSCDTTCTALTITNHQCVDLSDIGSNYLSRVPHDPTSGTDETTGYYLIKDENGALTIGACEAEGEGAGGNGTPPTIAVTR